MGRGGATGARSFQPRPRSAVVCRAFPSTRRRWTGRPPAVVSRGIAAQRTRPNAGLCCRGSAADSCCATRTRHLTRDVRSSARNATQRDAARAGADGLLGCMRVRIIAVRAAITTTKGGHARAQTACSAASPRRSTRSLGADSPSRTRERRSRRDAHSHAHSHLGAPSPGAESHLVRSRGGGRALVQHPEEERPAVLDHQVVLRRCAAAQACNHATTCSGKQSRNRARCRMRCMPAWCMCCVRHAAPRRLRMHGMQSCNHAPGESFAAGRPWNLHACAARRCVRVCVCFCEVCARPGADRMLPHRSGANACAAPRG